jgi:hypothetical protein
VTGRARSAHLAPFPRIESYALLAHCHTGALIATDDGLSGVEGTFLVAELV